MTKVGRILLAVGGWDPSSWLHEFRKNAPNRKIVTESDGPDDPSIRYAVVWNPPPGVLSGLPNLEAILSIGAGVDHILRDRQLPDVPILRIVADDLTTRMSEYVVWRVLDHFRQGPQYRTQQAEKRWRELPQPAARHVTVGIVGLGVLGRDAAAKLSNIGFNVVGWSRRPKPGAEISVFHGGSGLERLLSDSDIVVVLLPLTESTRGIVNAGFIGNMKQDTPLGGPVLINAGRGGLQVESDIVEALDRGTLKAASLDVFEDEPLPGNSPLWGHPDVTITPHAAATSDPVMLVPEILQQIENIELGKPPSGLVDRIHGY